LVAWGSVLGAAQAGDTETRNNDYPDPPPIGIPRLLTFASNCAAEILIDFLIDDERRDFLNHPRFDPLVLRHRPVIVSIVRTLSSLFLTLDF